MTRPPATTRPRRSTLRHSFFPLSPAASGLVLLLSGCGSSEHGTSANVVQGTPLQLPEVVYQDGPLLTAPEVVSVTFAGDSLASDLESFGQTVTASTWWETVMAGYCATDGGTCVGNGPAGTSVELTSSPQASYTDGDDGSPSTLQAWLSSSISSGTLPAPASGSPSNTLYVLYFPATTTITFDGVPSCTAQGFDGYHNWIAIGSQIVPYVVAVECPSLPAATSAVGAPTLLQNTTITASHEIVESSTDPVPPGTSNAISPGFALDGTILDNFGWIDVTGGGEAADMCVDFFGLRQDETSDGTFTVQRIWSTAQARSGVDPCNPIPQGDLYFNAAPEETAFFVIGVGQSETFYVDAFAQPGVGTWTLTVQDWSDSTSTYLGFSIPDAVSTSSGPELTVSDGVRVPITVTLLQDPGSLPPGEADGSIISLAGNPGAPTAAHFWAFAVMSPEDATSDGIPTTGGVAERSTAYARRSIHRSRTHHAGSAVAVRWRF